jgi:hypothetical protein
MKKVESLFFSTLLLALPLSGLLATLYILQRAARGIW